MSGRRGTEGQEQKGDERDVTAFLGRAINGDVSSVPLVLELDGRSRLYARRLEMPWECNSMKAGRKKTILGLVSAVIVCAALHAAGSWSVIAALRGTDVLLVDHSSGSVRKLTSDPRGKWALRWLPDGQRISYLVLSGTKEFPKFVMPSWPKLVISDLTGQVTREIPIRPAGNSSNPELIRAIEEVKWLSSQLVRFEGSFGPRNCAVFDLDLDTGRTLREWDLECATLVSSPDGKHVAYIEPVTMGTWDDRVHRVDIDDDGGVSYAGVGGVPVHVEAGPVWSGDSLRVAVLERQVQSGQMAVTTISTQGAVVTVPVPSETRVNPLLTWIGNRVALGSGSGALVVDPTGKAYSLVLDRDSSILDEAAQAGREIRDAKRSVLDVQIRLGAREAVAKPN